MQTGRVLSLSMGHLTNDIYPAFLAPLLPLLIDRLDLSLTLAAGLISIQAIFTSLSQPIFGHIADRLKHPYLVIFGPLITAFFYSSIGLADSYWHLVIIIICAGMGTAAFHPQAAALAASASGRQSGLGMSIFVTGGSAGFALGPVIIMGLVTTLGLAYTNLTIIFGLAISVTLFLVLPALPHAPKHNPPNEQAVTVRHVMASIIILFLVSAIRALLMAGFNTFTPIYLKAQHFPPMLYASALTIFAISGAVGSLISGGFSDRYGRKKVIFSSLAISLVFFRAFLYINGIAALIVFGIAGFFLMASIPVVIIAAQELFPARINTASSVVMGLAFGLGGLLVTPLGALADSYGVESAMKTLIGIGAVAALLALFLPETKNAKTT